ncbi:hypothetical protein HDV06_004492 [Boothiomyces sp. JEL0866]|nr:hypothetical protein HDV06_004492 [Boothiomyces sp. JEL0866]
MSVLWDYLSWTAKWTAILAVTGFAGLTTILYLNQNKILYPASFPQGSRENVPKPSEYDMHDWEDVSLRSSDGVLVKGYLIRKKSGDGLAPTTLIYYHANAGNMGHRLPIARALQYHLNCNVFMLSYRGYGLSDGSPDEKGMKLDAQAAFDYVTSHNQLKKSKIIIYGQSIGGAVAIHTAAKNQGKVDALIIENTFLSIHKLIPSVVPHLKYFTWLCHQIWNSELEIAKLENIPILFLSGKKDELIPPSHMQALHGIVKDVGNKKISYSEFKDGKHNDTCIQPGYFEAIAEFWKIFRK